MVGAPALAANAAFRTGAGLVQILTTKDAQSPVSMLAPCATTRVMTEGDTGRLAEVVSEFDADVVAIGPGLSPQVSGADVVRLMEGFEGGMVIDADGLNALARVGCWRAPRNGQVVVTPHPGEMRRLMAGLELDDTARAAGGDPEKQKPNDAEARREIAGTVAKETGAVVVLKGAGTVVSAGDRTYVNTTGHSGMATGGVGDVLTGVIAALMGQKMTAYDAAVLGVYLHGLAGDLAGARVGLVSLTALDMVEAIGNAIDTHGNASGRG